MMWSGKRTLLISSLLKSVVSPASFVRSSFTSEEVSSSSANDNRILPAFSARLFSISFEDKVLRLSFVVSRRDARSIWIRLPGVFFPSIHPVITLPVSVFLSCRSIVTVSVWIRTAELSTPRSIAEDVFSPPIASFRELITELFPAPFFPKSPTIRGDRSYSTSPFTPYIFLILNLFIFIFFLYDN